MLYISDNNCEERIVRRNNFQPALKRLLHGVWNILVSLVIIARDGLGSGRIQL